MSIQGAVLWRIRSITLFYLYYSRNPWIRATFVLGTVQVHDGDSPCLEEPTIKVILLQEIFVPCWFLPCYLCGCISSEIFFLKFPTPSGRNSGCATIDKTLTLLPPCHFCSEQVYTTWAKSTRINEATPVYITWTPGPMLLKMPVIIRVLSPLALTIGTITGAALVVI